MCQHGTSSLFVFGCFCKSRNEVGESSGISYFRDEIWTFCGTDLNISQRIFEHFVVKIWVWRNQKIVVQRGFSTKWMCHEDTYSNMLWFYVMKHTIFVIGSVVFPYLCNEKTFYFHTKGMLWAVQDVHFASDIPGHFFAGLQSLCVLVWRFLTNAMCWRLTEVRRMRKTASILMCGEDGWSLPLVLICLAVRKKVTTACSIGVKKRMKWISSFSGKERRLR